MVHKTAKKELILWKLHSERLHNGSETLNQLPSSKSKDSSSVFSFQSFKFSATSSVLMHESYSAIFSIKFNNFTELWIYIYKCRWFVNDSYLEKNVWSFILKKIVVISLNEIKSTNYNFYLKF